MDNFSFLSGEADEVAPQLLGCILERRLQGKILRAKVVETEAYTQHDAASHSFKGYTTRSAVMFGEPGYLYVYFTYGMHYCANIVVGPVGNGAAVLIRAVEPLDGLEIMQKLRPGRINTALTNGPAKLCQALAIDASLNGHDLQRDPLRLRVNPPLPLSAITCTPRIGISKDKTRPWRFFIAGNSFVSR